MSNKAIINGIDVSECEYINCCSKKTKCIILQDDILSDSQYCESEPNCYFKQLKRLEQINSELISKANAYDKLVILANDRLDIIDRLKQENEDLKQNWRLDCLKCEYKNTKADVDKYKQALENIRTYINQECKNKQCTQTCTNCFMGNVLIKVNEVLNDRD